MRTKPMYLLAFVALLEACAAIGPQPREAPSPPRPEATEARSRAEAILQALLALGVDYRNGGDSPALGFDCSGLVAHVFREAYGIELPRNSRAQSAAGIPVSAPDLRAGDLVF
ncbi:MAG: C40 family peptidase, partial [Burkholderiales bacterium]|nr:C40 family peptidase [Burkholderiales bacterium]